MLFRKRKKVYIYHI